MAISRSERKAWARERFRGVENYLVPSFTPDLRALDEAGIRRDVRQSIKHGFFGTLCAVEAGLDLAEAKRFVEVVADEANGEIEVGVSLYTDTCEDSRDLLHHAERVGASHALMAYPQNFWASDEDEVYRVTRELCDASSLGIMLHVADPLGLHRFHPSALPLDAYNRLVEVDNVVAMSIVPVEIGTFYEAFERWGDRVLVSSAFLAFAPLLTEIYGQQWLGPTNAEALQSPEKPYVVEFVDLLRQGRKEQAMALYWSLVPALEAQARLEKMTAQTLTQHWPRVKCYQWCTGGNGGYTREPVMKLYLRDIDAIKAGYRAIGIEPREPNEEFFVGRAHYERGVRAATTVEKALAGVER